MGKKQLRESVGLLAVVLSLVFVGLEMRQNNTIARASAINELASNQRDLLLSIVTDGELSSVWADYLRNGVALDSFNARDRTRLSGLQQALVINMENAFLQREMGLLPDALSGLYHFSGSPVFSSENFAAFWSNERYRYHPTFVAALEQEYPNLE
ncbi:MAG: hypothetical protein OXU33_14530 [Gemmatimonadota bacterium]|nr:hypothetical protein [Gemmatimonadota bacterium]MDE3015280.1 hypothetical protein [Gemmatimonadota bacterium]